MNQNAFEQVDFDRLQQGTFLKSIEWLAQASSTNSLAVEDCRDRCEIPRLILTDLQTAGRGRGDNQWWSTAGALTFTLIIERNQWRLPDDRLPMLSLVVGLAVVRSLQTALQDTATEHNLRLKWPNDVYLHDRKLAGILIESLKHHPDRLAIGIGLNLNNSLNAAPEDILHRAISLCDVTERIYSRTDLLIELFSELDILGNKLVHSSELILNEYRSLCWLTGKGITVINPNETVSGTCLGIDHSGALQLQSPSGIRRMLTGTIEVR